jgi:hypothetical protein
MLLRKLLLGGLNMVALTADDTTLLKEVGLFIEPVEVYDASGKLLGLFVPANLEKAKQMQAWVAANIDWAEIERQRQSKEPCAPFQDTLARLRQLSGEIDRRKAADEKEWTTDEALAYFSSLPRQSVPAASAPEGSEG